MTHGAPSRRQGRYHVFYRRVIFTLGVGGEPSWASHRGPPPCITMYYLSRVRVRAYLRAYLRACLRVPVSTRIRIRTYAKEPIARDRAYRVRKYVRPSKRNPERPPNTTVSSFFDSRRSLAIVFSISFSRTKSNLLHSSRVTKIRKSLVH